MKTAVLYGSTRGSTRKIVAGLDEVFDFEYEVFDLHDAPSAATLADYDLFVFFCPTYGDDEPQEDVERFMRGFDLDMSGRFIAVCGLGSSSGYDDFDPAGGRLVRERMAERGAREAVPGAAVDALPGMDRHLLERWCACVDAWVRTR